MNSDKANFPINFKFLFQIGGRVSRFPNRLSASFLRDTVYEHFVLQPGWASTSPLFVLKVGAGVGDATCTILSLFTPRVCYWEVSSCHKSRIPAFIVEGRIIMNSDGVTRRWSLAGHWLGENAILFIIIIYYYYYYYYLERIGRTSYSKDQSGKWTAWKEKKTPDPPGLEPGTLLVMSNALTTELWDQAEPRRRWQVFHSKGSSQHVPHNPDGTWVFFPPPGDQPRSVSGNYQRWKKVIKFGKDWENFIFKGSVGEVNCLKREKNARPTRTRTWDPACHEQCSNHWAMGPGWT